MRLAETGDCDPSAVWQYAERYLGAGTRTYSRFSADLEISPRYHPQQGEPSFRLPTVRVPDRRGCYLRNQLDSALHGLYRGDGWFLLPVHPDTWEDPDLPGRDDLRACPSGPPVEVVPAANARTVFVQRIGGRPVPAHFLKLHFPRRLSRFTRRLRRPIIELQLWVAAELHRAGVPFLAEVGGGVLGHDPREAWGFLLREPRLTRNRSLRFTVPLFALYGGDVRVPGDPTLLEQLVARSGQEPGAFLSRRIVAPMVRWWLRIARATGCLAELHGQNTLVTFSADGRRCRIGYRDCAVYVDPTIRRTLGLGEGLPPRNVISVDIDKPRAQVASLVYDTFMGHHALAYLAGLARDRLGVPESRLHRAARETFHRLAGPPLSLPETVYNYDDQLHPDGGWRLVDTGARPVWR